MSEHILLVEDELALGQGLKLNFELEGLEVEWVTTCAQARAARAARPPALVVLDLSLPDGDGLQLLEEIKRADLRHPVLVLTARSGDEDRVRGLSLGADDYLTKPFNLSELLLRVRGMLRRSAWYAPAPSAQTEIALGEARLRVEDATLTRGESCFTLTELELRLLMHLWRKRGNWIARDELLVEVWGYAQAANTRTVDAFISRLRRMLGDSALRPRLLLTRRGKGYMLAKDAEPRA